MLLKKLVNVLEVFLLSLTIWETLLSLQIQSQYVRVRIMLYPDTQNTKCYISHIVLY